VKWDNRQAAALYKVENTLANTVTAHDATGATFTLALAAVDAAVAALAVGGITGGNVTITGTDGTSTVLLAQGTWSVALTA
jgi:hypothetical protein